MSDSLISLVMTLAWFASFNRKTFSMTEISVAVVSNPQKADQSFTTRPAPITSLPLFMVPAYEASGRHWIVLCVHCFYRLTTNGTWRSELSSSWSATVVLGCTIPPWWGEKELAWRLGRCDTISKLNCGKRAPNLQYIKNTTTKPWITWNELLKQALPLFNKQKNSYYFRHKCMITNLVWKCTIRTS